MGSKPETKYDRLLAWKRGENPGPWTISLYPTYRCNIQCKICWKREFDEPLKPSEELPDDRLLSLIDEAADLGVREWIVGGGGELMLRGKTVMRMVTQIRSRGMNGLIQTNGTRFTDENLETLVDLQWDKLNVSLDGPTREINDSIRIEKNFDQTVDTLRRLQAIKKRRNSEFPVINLISVITNKNYLCLEQFADLHAELELTPGYHALVDLIVYGEHDKAYALNPEQRNGLPAQIEKAFNNARARNIANNYSTYLGGLDGGRLVKAMDLFSGSEDHVSSKTMCFEPFLHMLILPEGLTGPCCTSHDPNADSVWDTPMKEVWMGPYMQQVRRQILAGKTPSYCAECMITRIQENRYIQAYLAEIERCQELTLPVKFSTLFAKANACFKRNGLTKSIRRGGEWILVRSRARRLLESGAPKV